MLKLLKKFLWKIRTGLYKYHLRKKVVFDPHTQISCNTVFEGGNRVARGATVVNSSIGFGTLIAPDINITNTKIGRYSMIGSEIIRGRHPVDWVSTHPAFYSLQKQCGFTYVTEQLYEENKYADDKNKISVIIGSDVWLTRETKVVEGVTIGDGAVVLNGAVVTKDVPPYAIVGGVPAKIIRYRFDSDTIDWLLELKWWDKDEEWIKAHAPYFSDPQKLREVLEAEKI